MNGEIGYDKMANDKKWKANYGENTAKRKTNWIGYVMRGEELMNEVLEERRGDKNPGKGNDTNDWRAWEGNVTKAKKMNGEKFQAMMKLDVKDLQYCNALK